MSVNLSLDCQEFDDYLVDTYEDCIQGYTGIHYIFRFPNGYGASVVKAFGSAGYSIDMWELAVILYEEENKKSPDEYVLAYPYPIVKHECVLGPLNDNHVKEVLQKIKEL